MASRAKKKIPSRFSNDRLKIAIVALLFGAVGGTLIYTSRASVALPSDINSDGIVNITDLSILLSNWGKTATPTPPGPGPTPPPPPPSSGTFDYPASMTGPNWKVTLPIPSSSSSSSPLEIKQPQYATYSKDPYFKLNTAKNGVLFRAYHGGVTTDNSANPRSELREMTSNGTANASWSSSSGTHQMTVRLKVNRLTKVRPHTVIAQIHDADDDTTVFRLEGSSLWITDGDTTHGNLVTSDFKLNTEYTIGFKVSGGKINYIFNGQQLSYSQSKSVSGCYFKTGAYLQSNSSTASGESTSEYTEVEIFDVKVSHS